jgi:hypothetical protein
LGWAFDPMKVDACGVRDGVRSSDRLTLIALSLVMLLTACGGRGDALAGPDPGGGYP